MSEVDIVAEMRDQAEWQETALDNPFTAKDMRRWATEVERLRGILDIVVAADDTKGWLAHQIQQQRGLLREDGYEMSKELTTQTVYFWILMTVIGFTIFGIIFGLHSLGWAAVFLIFAFIAVAFGVLVTTIVEEAVDNYNENRR